MNVDFVRARIVNREFDQFLDLTANVTLRLSPRLTQPVKTLYAVR